MKLNHFHRSKPSRQIAFAFALAIAGSSLILAACGSSSSTTASNGDSTANATQAGVAEANSSAQASESSTSVGFMEDIANAAGAPIHQMSTCTYSSVRGACSGSGPYTDTITWGGCTVAGGYVTMTGSWSESFSGGGITGCTVPLVNGEQVTRTTTGSTMSVAILGVTPFSVTTDTSGGTAWDGTSIPANQGTVVLAGSSSRTITINGTHRLATDSSGGKIFEHFITGNLTATGTRAAGNRVITGTEKVYHQIAKYTAALTFNNVTWGSATCCFPTSGSINTTLTGSVTGSTTMTFTSTCGTATYVNEAGTSSNYTLSQCH